MLFPYYSRLGTADLFLAHSQLVLAKLRIIDLVSVTEFAILKKNSEIHRRFCMLTALQLLTLLKFSYKKGIQKEVQLLKILFFSF